VLPRRLRQSLLGYRGGGFRSRVVFGRVLTPDPSRPLRVALTLNAHRAGGPVAGICATTVLRDGAGGGCSPYPGVFASSPIAAGEFAASGTQQFIDVGGMASDAVARLRVLLENRQWVDVPLADNTFAVELPLAHLPARLVAYDRDGRVIGVGEPIDSFGGTGPTQAPGKATQLLAVHGPNGSHEELLVGPATGGGECMYVKHWFSKRQAGTMEGCFARAWRGSPVQLSTDSYPPIFISGRVRGDVARVRVVFANGGTMLVTPTRGFVLAVVPAAHRSAAGRPVTFVAESKRGGALGTETLPPPPKRSW
jgi:hypothetical protein